MYCPRFSHPNHSAPRIPLLLLTFSYSAISFSDIDCNESDIFERVFELRLSFRSNTRARSKFYERDTNSHMDEFAMLPDTLFQLHLRISTILKFTAFKNNGLLQIWKSCPTFSKKLLNFKNRIFILSKIKNKT